MDLECSFGLSLGGVSSSLCVTLLSYFLLYANIITFEEFGFFHGAEGVKVERSFSDSTPQFVTPH